jgi:hypothetical protein
VDFLGGSLGLCGPQVVHDFGELLKSLAVAVLRGGCRESLLVFGQYE